MRFIGTRPPFPFQRGTSSRAGAQPRRCIRGILQVGAAPFDVFFACRVLHAWNALSTSFTSNPQQSSCSVGKSH